MLDLQSIYKLHARTQVLEEQLVSLREERDEEIFSILEVESTAKTCLQIAKMTPRLYQKWLGVRMAIRYVEPSYDIEIFAQLRLRCRIDYDSKLVGSFVQFCKKTTNRHRLIKLLEIEDYDGHYTLFYWVESWLRTETDKAIAERAEKRQQSLSLLGLPYFDKVHRQGHWQDKQLRQRFIELIQQQAITSPSELRKALGRRPREWELACLEYVNTHRSTN